MQSLHKLWCTLLAGLLLLLSLGQPMPVAASGPTWQWTGPDGGIIYALAVHPTTPTTLYAASSNHMVYKSTDAGATWSGVKLTSGNVEAARWQLTPRRPLLYTLAQAAAGCTKARTGAQHGVV